MRDPDDETAADRLEERHARNLDTLDQLADRASLPTSLIGWDVAQAWTDNRSLKGEPYANQAQSQTTASPEAKAEAKAHD